MKKQLLIFLAGLPLCVSAQSKIDLPGLERIQSEKQLMSAKSMSATDGALIPVIVVAENENCAAVLEAEGLSVNCLGSTILTEIPLNRIEKISQLPEVKFISLEQEMNLMMDFARPACNVTEAQEGFTHEGTQLSFNGEGVLVSLFDTGIDVNHVNFKDAEGNTRVKRAWLYTNSSTPKEYTPDSRFSNISSATTDNAGQSHATHVAGIMGGSYNDTGKFAKVATASGRTQQIVEDNIPFYGVATGADLAFACGSLTNTNIVNGVQRIVNFAKSEGLPVTVNLSLGTTIGPHDGTDSFSQSLATLGKDAVICISAGNDGDVDLSICREVGSDTPIRTMFDGNTCKSPIDIWGSDATPFRVGFGIYEAGSGTVTELGSVSEAGKTVSINTTNSVFAASFTGSITMRSDVNRLNNRYNVYCSCSFAPLNASSKKMVLFAESDQGKMVYVYGTSDMAFTSNGQPGFDNGSPENSINDNACAENVISVGAFTTRNSWGCLGGGPYTYTGSGFSVGKISGFSSYGKTFAGKQLPLVAAPGAGIVSSMSRFYVAATNSAKSMTATAEVDGITNYWANQQGTSMSCPYVTGVVGLWLQACPTLNFTQVMDVIDNTSTFSAITMKDGRWGAGKIDAVAGLKYVLQNYSAIGSVWEDDAQRFILTPAADGYDVTLAGEARFTVSLTDMQGRTVATAEGFDGAAAVSTAALTQGIYVLTVQSPSTRLSRKIAVR